MSEHTESGRRKNWNDGENEKKGKSGCRQSRAGTEPETKETSAAPAEWMPMGRRGAALQLSRVLAAEGARHPEWPPCQVFPLAAQIDFQNQGATSRNAAHPCGPPPVCLLEEWPPPKCPPAEWPPHLHAAPLPMPADTLRPIKSEICASATQGRQFD